MTRITQYLTFALIGLTGCNTGSVREASAQQIPATPRSASGMRPASGPQQTYELRRVWSGSDFNFYWNEPSPDGRYVSEIDWNTGNLAVTDLLTGEIEQVTHQTNYDEGFAYGSVFSPDGKQLAYRWFSMADESDLRIIGVDGSNERVLVGVRPDVSTILPTDWSADGRHVLAAVQRPDNTVQLVLIAVADGSMQVLKSLGWRWTAEALLSPDGRYVAYSLREGSPGTDADPPALQILAVDGSREVLVAPHDGRQRMLGWTPDGGAVLFYRHEGTSGSIWMVAIQDGRQVGEPVVIEPDVRVSSIGFSEDAYFFGTQIESQQVHTATIDPAGGGFVADPRPVGDPGTPRTTSGAWSVDGAQLAYVRREPSGEMLIVRAVDGGEERAIPLSAIEGAREVVWAPDGESVLLIGIGKGKLGVGLAVYRIDLTSGDATFVVGGRPRQIVGLAVARDGQTLYFGRSREGVARYDLSSGEETLLHADSVSARFLLAVSPDGRMIAFTGTAVDPKTNLGAPNRILLMPTDGRGEAREVFRAEWPHHVEWGGNIAWTPDGRGVLFVRGDQDKPHVLSRVSADGGPVTDLMRFACDQGDCTLRNLQIHPDGRRIALDLGKPKGEIWMLTGFSVGDIASGTSQGR